MWTLVAATAATGCPLYRALSVASTLSRRYLSRAGPSPRFDHLVAGIGQISAREDGLDPRQSRSFRSIYGLDARMGVGRAQDLSVEQAGQLGVSAVNGAPSDLVNAVVADGGGCR